METEQKVPLVLSKEERLEAMALTQQQARFMAEAELLEMKLNQARSNLNLAKDALAKFGDAFRHRYGVNVVSFDGQTGVARGADGKPILVVKEPPDSEEEQEEPDLSE